MTCHHVCQPGRASQVRVPSVSRTRPQHDGILTATINSWGIEFVGIADDLLFEHIANYSKEDGAFARYTLIVQSSGMGKSRTIDELSKKHLVVPLNLRGESNGDS